MFEHEGVGEKPPEPGSSFGHGWQLQPQMSTSALLASSNIDRYHYGNEGQLKRVY